MPRLSDRARRQAAARILASTHAAELRYVRDLRAVVRGMHSAFMAYLEPRLGEVAGRRDTRVTRHSLDLDGLQVEILKQVPEKVGPLFDRMADGVDKANEKGAVALMGIKPSRARIDGQISAARDKNIRLVEDAGRAYAQSVREIFEAPESFGLRVEELRDRLLERGDVSESRAALIARDQTLKLNGDINRIRQTNAGVERYTWSTSKDEKVRPEHAANEGQIFEWSSPPPETGHPGEDFQCRCIAIPIIPELEGL